MSEFPSVLLLFWLFIIDTAGVKMEAEPHELRTANNDPIEQLKLCILKNASIEASSEDVFLGNSSFPSSTKTIFRKGS